MDTLKIILLFAIISCTSCKSLVDVPLDDINAEANVGLVQSEVNLTGDGALIVVRDMFPWVAGAISILILAIACRNISIQGSYHIEAGDDPIDHDD